MPDHTSNGHKSFTSPGLRLKTGLAEMLKGGVIMDVMDVDQAIIAEQAGAVAVMALERVPRHDPRPRAASRACRTPA